MKKILIACEESQAVATEFRSLGLEAYSCDILDCSGGHSEWHIKQDVLPILNGLCEFQTCDGTVHKIDGKWDLIIGHPPCNHLAVSGARHFEKKREDGRQRDGIEFFCKILGADCDRIVVENPVNIISGSYVKKWFPDLCDKYGLPIKPTQKIHPWMFGDNFSKCTCLWIKGLPKLIKEIDKEPELDWIEWTDKKTGKKKRQDRWCYDILTKCSAEERGKLRSKTFPGIAKAMATQWGKYLVDLEEE